MNPFVLLLPTATVELYRSLNVGLKKASGFILILLAASNLSLIAAEAGEDLTGPEIAALLGGHSMRLSRIAGKYEGEIHWEPIAKAADCFGSTECGVVTGYVEILSFKRYGGGKWWIDKNRYCRVIQKDKKCLYVEINPDRSVQFSEAIITGGKIVRNIASVGKLLN
jgi:hypothetical protein